MRRGRARPTLYGGEPQVAIVGRPNVGKSRLFNRLLRRRVSIVHDEPGVTRDAVMADAGGFLLVDTGGIGLVPGDTPEKLVKATEVQVAYAVGRADLILFVVDAREGLTPLDLDIAARLRGQRKPVLLVLNKVDTGEVPAVAAEFYRLGFGEPAVVSAEHGVGEDDLRRAIAERVGLPLERVLGREDRKPRRVREVVAPEEAEEEVQPEVADADDGSGEGVDAEVEDAPRGLVLEGGGEKEAPRVVVSRPVGPLQLAVVGRPNVGKSSLGNRLLRSERLIVSEIPGTTRDAIDLDCTWRWRDQTTWTFRLIDTAGIRHGQKVSSPVELFSRYRSLDAIGRADVCCLLLDAMDGVTRQDKAVGGEIIARHRPMVVAVNKWDLVLQQFRNKEVSGYASESEYRRLYAESAREQLFFTPGSPVVFLSAKTGHSVERLLKAVRDVESRLDRVLPTGQLNRCIGRLTEAKPPPAVHGVRFRAYYAVQTGTRPYRLKVFCNQEGRLSESYRRYLEAGVATEFELAGCPVLFELVGKKSD